MADMRAGALLLVEALAVTMVDASNWSTDVAPEDDGKASENNNIEKETADVTVGANKLSASVHLLHREGGARLHFSSTSLINNKNNRQIIINL